MTTRNLLFNQPMKQDLTATVPCWSCKREVRPLFMKDVRLMRCPNPACKAELPGVRHGEYGRDRLKEKLPARIRGTVNEPGYGW